MKTRLTVAIGALTLAAITGSAMAQTYTYTGSETNITLPPGTYDITVYGAAGGNSLYSGGLGAEMEAQFNFATAVNLTILVGGSGGSVGASNGGGGGGGSFVVTVIGNVTNALVIAGGG
ncbi:MAG: glycine-rich protein, partial [Verrucomicrobiia bacterium]